MKERRKYGVTLNHKTIVPELFSDPRDINREPGEIIERITIRVSVEGCYMENGQFRVTPDQMFRPNGFDRTGEVEFWTATGYFKKKR